MRRIGKRWLPVGVEPVSGEVKIVSAMGGLIGEVLVKAGDKVSGSSWIRLRDGEAPARIASAEAQIGMRRRARNDQTPSSRAGDRRKAEDAVADGEKGVTEAQAAFDRTALDRRAGRASDAEVETARVALTRAQDRVRQQRADLRKLETALRNPVADPGRRSAQYRAGGIMGGRGGIGEAHDPAPIAGTVLQVNAKPGEMAALSATQPLVLLGDLSALRVRAELDERDFGEIKIGQVASVRPAAFRNREFPGTVSFIAPLVEPSRNGTRGQRNQTDVDVVEVLIDLADPGPLAVGMKVDVYFRYDTAEH